MSKKWWLLLAALLACVVAACVALYPKPSAEKIAFDRIEVGMSYAEVEGIFGRHFDIVVGLHIGPITGYIWNFEEGGSASVAFANSAVTGKEWIGSRTSLTARLRRWLPFLK